MFNTKQNRISIRFSLFKHFVTLFPATFWLSIFFDIEFWWIFIYKLQKKQTKKKSRFSWLFLPTTFSSFKVLVELRRVQIKQCELFRVRYERDKKIIKTKDGEEVLSLYLFKVNNGNTRTVCEICSKITIKTPLTTLLMSLWCLYLYLWADLTHWSGVSIVDFEQINAGWEVKIFTSEGGRYIKIRKEIPLTSAFL